MEYEYLTTIGQDSHRFEECEVEGNTIKLGGYDVPYSHPFSANSDGDVILHALTNCVSGYTGINILGGAADKLCLEQGIMDSRVFLYEAMKSLGDAKITFVSISVECLVPKLKPHIEGIKNSLSEILGIPASRIGLTATTGEKLTGMGRGEGLQVFAAMTFKVPVED